MDTRRPKATQTNSISSTLHWRLVLSAAVVGIYFSLFAVLMNLSRLAQGNEQAAVSAWPAALVAAAMICFVALTGVFVFVRRGA